eukprot:TRINITY_DN73373_c0_g1_i1.p1 TRINITY_DN73373_c0_g1~~TRINITY_DN73373_c0_g1_i1.p1  ORF type:complete len:180 (-),score=58.62 TRINITY_DN73373_c0_g1_i1:69-608(-)
MPAPTEHVPQSSDDWEKAKAELESLDQEIARLRQQLRDAEEKRKALAANEEALRSQNPNLKAAPGQTECIMFEMEQEESPQQANASGDADADASFFGDAELDGDDWERGFDAIGVAKCGVCGMKFPLDMGAIETHSLECEAALKEGRKPVRSDFTTKAPRDRAASLRMKLAGKSAGYAR